MKKQLLISTLFISLVNIMSFAQSTSNLVVFSEAGEKFILSIDGVVQNSEPATNVKATGLTGDFHQVSVQFADKNLGFLNQNMMLKAGLEQKAVIKLKKKGGYALRPFGEPVAISQAPETPPTPPTPPLPVYVHEPEIPVATQSPTITAPVPTPNTSPSTINNGTTEFFNMNIGIGETQMGVNIQINDGMGGMVGMGTSTTVHTTETVTHTNSSGLPVQTAPAPVVEEVVHTCGPMAGGDFGAAKKSISSKSFEDSKMTTAKQILKGNCMSTDQIVEMMALLTYEDSKLEFAKAAHDKCSDPQNYWKLNDAFTFSSSIDELNEYIESK